MQLTTLSKRLLLGIPLLLILSIIWPFFLELIGFHTLYPGWEVAEQLIEKGKSVEGCRKIVRGFWWDVLSPPTREQRSLCIYTYAAQTKNPSVCGLLMPSMYGFSCIG